MLKMFLRAVAFFLFLHYNDTWKHFIQPSLLQMRKISWPNFSTLLWNSLKCSVMGQQLCQNLFWATFNCEIQEEFNWIHHSHKEYLGLLSLSKRKKEGDGERACLQCFLSTSLVPFLWGLYFYLFPYSSTALPPPPKSLHPRACRDTLLLKALGVLVEAQILTPSAHNK